MIIHIFVSFSCFSGGKDVHYHFHYHPDGKYSFRNLTFTTHFANKLSKAA